MGKVFFLVILIVVTLCCCVQKPDETSTPKVANTPTKSSVNNSEEVGMSTQKITTPQKCNFSKVEVHFFYSPYCPHCEEVKPYIINLSKKYRNVKFYFCNVANTSQCPRESMKFAGMVFGVPTVVIYYNNTPLMLIGSNNVKKLEGVLRCLGCCKN